MVTFKSNIMMICIIINIAHADYHEDKEKCLNELKLAFKYKKDSAASCLRHAIQFYVKDQRISVEDKNFGISSQSDNDDPAEIFDQWFQNELSKNTISTSWDESDGQHVVEGGSQNDSEIFDQWFQNELNQKTISTSWDESDGQHVVEVSNNSEQFPNWWENENWTVNEGQQANEDETDDMVAEWLNIDEATVEDENQSVASSSQGVSAQQDYPLNYAEMYLKELENMISGKYVLNRNKFCTQFYKYEYRLCYKALKSFGDNPTYSVQVALNTLTLAYCAEKLLSDQQYVYIYQYMVHIIKTCRVEGSTRPSTFCEKLIMAKYNLTKAPK